MEQITADLIKAKLLDSNKGATVTIIEEKYCFDCRIESTRFSLPNFGNSRIALTTVPLNNNKLYTCIIITKP